MNAMLADPHYWEGVVDGLLAFAAIWVTWVIAYQFGKTAIGSGSDD